MDNTGRPKGFTKARCEARRKGIIKLWRLGIRAQIIADAYNISAPAVSMTIKRHAPDLVRRKRAS